MKNGFSQKITKWNVNSVVIPLTSIFYWQIWSITSGNMKSEFLFRKYMFILWKWYKIFCSKYWSSLASPPVWQFVDAILEKLFLFWDKPVIEPISYIFVRSEALISKCVSHRWKYIGKSERARSGEKAGCKRISQLNASIVSLIDFAGCDSALTCCFFLNSGRFSLKASFKSIIYCR